MSTMPNMERVAGLLAYADPYVREPLEPPIGLPSDHLTPENVEVHASWFETFAKVRLEPSRLLDYAARDRSQLPAASNRSNYHKGRDAQYWLSGLGDYLNLVQRVGKLGVKGGRLLDFGGGSGRVHRHFLYDTEAWDVWACDFNMACIEWSIRHLPSRLKPFLNNYYPSLPLEDCSFDLVTAFSVFTHLDETELSWLLELRRILRPGGFAYITLSDEHTWRSKPPYLFQAIAKTNPEYLDVPEIPEGKTVVNWRSDSPYRCNVFHSPDYVQSVWGRFFKLREVFPLGHNVQSVYLFQKL